MMNILNYFIQYLFMRGARSGFKSFLTVITLTYVSADLTFDVEGHYWHVRCAVSCHYCVDFFWENAELQEHECFFFFSETIEINTNAFVSHENVFLILHEEL